ncbi:delta(14)-sterol reductase TM7SF2-like [Littorina saxatilis]|uniref:Delta(14)-sterol reductase n=1 Tax=Littorina saxatilis TaxID=31220 RepID=A0AAN9BEZ5_9CAEN
MPTPRKARARSRQRSKSASRSRSRGRPASTGKKTRTSSRTPSASPGRKARYVVSNQEKASVAKQEKASVVSNQEKASVTPVRQSARIASIVAHEKHSSSKTVEKITAQARTTMSDKEKPAQRTKNYEFGGPIGAFLMIFFLPATVYLVNLACRNNKCTILEIPKLPSSLAAVVDFQATLIFLGWFVFQAILAVLPIGRVVDGQPLKSGERLKYRLNGFLALLVSLLAVGVGVYYKVPVTLVYKKFFKVMTTAVVFSFLLSFFLYIKSRFVPQSKLAAPGNSGNVIYDFFMGHELNPRIGPLDLKFFCELRPGLIGWVVLNLAMLLEAYQRDGTFPPALTMVVVFQFIYVADALWFEDAILTTMDIVHDGFGFMLAFGDLAWVPFLYCLQPRFLLESRFNLPWYCLAPIALLNVIGYYIFRGANSQKNEFRKDPFNPNVKHLETIPTPSGKRLLVSGWWGVCRKPNYLGDLLMALSWSLPCGFGHILPYFYPIYFFILLVHRERRDDAHCKQKYGASWERYCERVRYRIIPYVY